MELYTLDSLYRRIGVIDKYESLIWTERMTVLGDFELKMVSSRENRGLFITGTTLAMNRSNRLMVVETVQDITDDDGRRFIKVTGPSYETVLRQRLTAYNTAGTWGKWGNVTDVPLTILNNLFNDICVDGNLNAGDIISPLIVGDFYPTDTIAEPSDDIFFPPAEYQDLYTTIKNLCEAFAIGFRFVRHPVLNLLYFDFYMGSDRTTAQTTLPAVVFSPDLDNLRNTNRLQTSAIYKNVAYVINASGHQIVYQLDIDTSIAGFDRRVLVVIADDDDDSAAMIQKGKDELAKNRMFSALDGQLATNSSYIYEQDYYLGDLVELRDDDGTTSQMQVTEQIFVSDAEGERTYPTLSVNLFITPGSWSAWDYNQVWEDLDDEKWEDQP